MTLWVILLGLLCAPARADTKPLPWLHAEGTQIVDASGQPVPLRGFNVGGGYQIELWLAALNLDRQGTDLPEIRDEKTLWDVLERRFGPDRRARLQQTWRASWLSAGDIDRLAALGCNVVRIPFWYRLVADEGHQERLLPTGTRLLDDLLAACARSHVYAILDLHGAPGGQSADAPTSEKGRNELFRSPARQEETAALWTALARRYCDHPEVAGYDLLNEPMGAPDAKALIALHDRLYQAIRRVDTRHLIILEDGYKGADAFPNPAEKGWQNVCYSIHLYRFGATSPEAHAHVIRDELPRWRERQLAWNVPLYIGEFSTQTEVQGGAKTMADYFAAFDRYGWSWTPWNFKQIDPTDGRHSIWGLYTNAKPWDQANPYTDSFDTLQAKFHNYDTANLSIQPRYRQAVMNDLQSHQPEPARRT